MQFLMVNKSMTLSSLADRVGERNVDDMLNTNSLTRSVNIGKQFYVRANQDISEIDSQTKINILNTLVGNSDIYEKAALGSEQDWNCLAKYGCFSDAMKIPENIQLSSATDIIGNDEPIDKDIYEKCVYSLTLFDRVDPTIFDEKMTSGSNLYAIISNVKDTPDPKDTLRGLPFNVNGKQKISPLQGNKLPWGMITLYSSISKTSMEIPAYPEEGIQDGYKANFAEMGEILYQYEPWNVYKSSGPRQITFTFHLHRDMWTGDHTDGNANKLIRFCEANCFPKYEGSAVNASQVSLYINGENYITGLMTDCNVVWRHPIATDGFYLDFDLSFTILEVSPYKLNYDSVMQKGLIS